MNGQYYFNATNVDENGVMPDGSAAVGFTGLSPNTSYVVQITNAEGGSQQAALTGFEMTATDANGNNSDKIDNDASSDGTNATIMAMTADAGCNDHSFDFGFIFSCPEITMLGVSTNTICEGETIDLTITHTADLGDVAIYSAASNSLTANQLYDFANHGTNNISAVNAAISPAAAATSTMESSVMPTATGNITYYAILAQGNANISDPDCLPMAIVTITVNPLPTPADAPITICADETSTNLTDSDATILDGDAGTVSWYDGDPAAGGTVINTPTDVDLNMITDLYARVTTTTGSCTADVDVTVTINPLAPDPTNPMDNSFCDGATVTPLSVDDPGAGFTVTWWTAATDGSQVTGATLGGNNDEEIILSTTSAPAAPVVGNSVTIYAQIENDPTTCTSPNRVAVTLTNHENPTIGSISPMVCTDEMTTLQASVTGGMAAYSYMWTATGITPFGGMASSTDETPTFDATGLMPGDYTVELMVTDANGCTDTDNITVTVQSGPDATFTTLDEEVCDGMMGVVYSVPDQGVGTTYTWNVSNGTIVSGGDTDDTQVTVDWDQSASTGNIMVTVTLASGCSGQNMIDVTIHPNPTVEAASNSPVCAGTDLNLMATPGAGTAPFNFVWSGPNSFSSPLQNPVISNVTTAAAGTYTVMVTDSEGCTATNTVDVVVSEIQITDMTQSVCNG